MKKIHIFLIVVIGISIAVIATTAGDASVYVSFKEAKEMAASGDLNNVHVVGQLTRDDYGNIVGIEQPDMLSFSFIMIDNNSEIRKVYFAEPMPADFERSEQVVVVGAFKGDVFVAKKILLKCPSKYEEAEITT